MFGKEKKKRKKLNDPELTKTDGPQKDAVDANGNRLYHKDGTPIRYFRDKRRIPEACLSKKETAFLKKMFSRQRGKGVTGISFHKIGFDRLYINGTKSDGYGRVDICIPLNDDMSFKGVKDGPYYKADDYGL